FFSLESSCAFFWSFQTVGSSSEALTVLRRSDFASKSKIPPEGLRAGGEIGQLRADRVDAFCVHVVGIRKTRILRRCHCGLDPQSSGFNGRSAKGAELRLRAAVAHRRRALEPLHRFGCIAR